MTARVFIEFKKERALTERPYTCGFRHTLSATIAAWWDGCRVEHLCATCALGKRLPPQGDQ
jgi:hypothetical protein